MANLQISKEEMERTRVARRRDLKAFPESFVDTVIPEFKRNLFSIIGAGVFEDPDMRPAISEQHCFTLSMIEVEPGQGAGLHSHDTEEVFIPMDGKFAIYWGDDGENEIELDAMDTVSVPIGVMRGFRNPGDTTVHVIAVVGGHDGGRLKWHKGVIERAAEHGGALSNDGYMVKD